MSIKYCKDLQFLIDSGNKSYLLWDFANYHGCIDLELIQSYPKCLWNIEILLDHPNFKSEEIRGKMFNVLVQNNMDTIFHRREYIVSIRDPSKGRYNCKHFPRGALEEGISIWNTHNEVLEEVD